MPRKKPSTNETPVKRMRPALTPEARENQMIALAIDCAEKQMREGKNLFSKVFPFSRPSLGESIRVVVLI